MRLRVVALACTLLAAACQPTDQTEATADVSEKAAGVNPAANGELRNAWIAAAERDDAAAVASLYTEDAIFMVAGSEVLSGRAAIEASLAESFKTSSGLTVTEESSETVGDVVYSTGQWRQKAGTPDGKTVDTEGRYLVITRLQEDGTLKIVRHVSMPMEPAPAPTSQRSWPGSGPSRASVTARTSRLVSWPSSSKASSGRPGTAGRGTVPASATASTAVTTSGSVSACAQAAAVPANVRSSGPPSWASAVTRLAP